MYYILSPSSRKELCNRHNLSILSYQILHSLVIWIHHPPHIFYIHLSQNTQSLRDSSFPKPVLLGESFRAWSFSLFLAWWENKISPSEVCYASQPKTFPRFACFLTHPLFPADKWCPWQRVGSKLLESQAFLDGIWPDYFSHHLQTKPHRQEGNDHILKLLFLFC